MIGSRTLLLGAAAVLLAGPALAMPPDRYMAVRGEPESTLKTRPKREERLSDR